MVEINLKKEHDVSYRRFNYRGQHRYLVTMQTRKRREVFSATPLMMEMLNVLRGACLEQQFNVHAYCILPHEVVLLIQGKTEQADMKAFLRALRASSRTVFAGDGDLWARTYTERVLRKTEQTRDVARSVLNRAEQPSTYGTGVRPISGSFV
jgi:REP element-mobilizing transposase RayT